MSSKEIITILGRLNMPVNNHMSVMEPGMVSAVESFFSDVKARAATKTAAEQQRIQAQEAARKRQLEQSSSEGEANITGNGLNEKDGNERLANGAVIAPIRKDEERQATNLERSRTLTVEHDQPPVAKEAHTEASVIPAAREDSAITGARSTQLQTGTSRVDRNAGGSSSQGRQQSQGGRERFGDRSYDERTARAGNTSQDGASATAVEQSPSQNSGPRYQTTDRPYGNRPQGDRPQGDRPYGNRPQGDRPQGDRPYGNRPQGDRTQGDRPYGNRPQGDRPQGDRPYGNRPQGDRPQGDRPYGNRPQGDRPQGDRPYGNRPQGDRPQGDRPYGNRPQGDRPYGNRPQGDRPYGNRPQGERTGGYAGGAPRSGGGAPRSGGGAPRSGGGAPGGNRPFGDRPARTSDAGRPAGFGPDRKPAGRNDARGGRAFGGGTAGSPNGADRGGQNSASRNKRGGDRTQNSRNTSSDRRENARKIQPPRGRKGRAEQVTRTFEGPRTIKVDGPMTVSEFAHMLRREASEVIKKLLFLGVLVTINQEIDTDTMVLVGNEFGTEVQVAAPRDIEAEEMLHEVVDQETLEHRAPIVTIMGHVDHGKTTLLDSIRETNVTASEAGGITQHIGAYQVEINHKKITFLDTPGHEAFTTMRARGAQVTDITVLVVAADDGVMPQTVEAINHAKAANVPIIVAVNKMDKPGANPDRVKQELTEHGLVAEEWGGDTIFVPVSALKREGIDTLLEMILLVAEVADLKASLSSRARGSVIEAQLDKGRGPVATILVQTGTLRVGDVVVAGNTFGKVRAMVNDRGRRVKEAYPSTPVEIVGLGDVPSAGDPFVVYDDERQARQVAERRAGRQRAEELGATSRVTLDDLYKQIQEGEVKDLNLILKADVHGSSEAVLGALQKIDVSGVRIRVLHTGVGAITESDILLASASNAIVIGFNVRPEPNAQRMGESEKVDVRLYRVIYNLIEEIEAALKGMLDPVYKEVVLGRAEIRQVFKVSKIGNIAGAMVQEGKLVRDSQARLIRGGVVIHDGRLDSLKRFKDDAREVAFGYECGLTFERFNDIKEGDIVEAYKMEVVKQD
ncbi:translation initiation factor IF-2 [Ferroacidibacillus organovorans]